MLAPPTERARVLAVPNRPLTVVKRKRATALQEAVPPGLPANFVAPAKVPELLEAAADLVDFNGHHQGEHWTELQFGRSLYTQRVSGHAALYLAAGFNPYMRTFPQLAAPQVVTQAEEWLAAYLIVRGEETRYDEDGYLDLDLIIASYEQDREMTGPELVDMWRDCADYVRAGGGR